MKRTVLITGACKNSGYGIVQKFAQCGWQVVVTSRNAEEAKQTAERLSVKYQVNAYGLQTSAQDSEEEIEEKIAILDRAGFSVDCIVLNAADLGVGQEFFSLEISQFKEVFETNVFWNFMLVRCCAKRMKEKKKGSIVFVTSNTAYRAIPDRAAYESSKGAILALSRALALDLGKYGIRSNCVLPGMIKTDRWVNNIGDIQNAPSRYTPIGDIADFEDIANAVYYFADDRSKNTTGAELVVDGGNMIQMYPIIPKEIG